MTELSDVAIVTSSFHCPPWCVVGDNAHDAESASWDGGVLHRSTVWTVDGIEIRITCATQRDGAHLEPPYVHVNGAMLTPDRARTLATAIASAGAVAG